MDETCAEAFLHAHVSFAVIGCGWLQALRVAGVHLVTAKMGGQAHPPQTSPLDIFMYQVGLPIASLHYSRPHTSLFTNANHSFQVPRESECVKMWLSRIFIPHIISLAHYPPSYCVFTFLYNHTLLPPPRPFRSSRHTLTPSPPLHLHVSPLHLLSLSSATGDPNIYRKPPIYTKTGTVQ